MSRSTDLACRIAFTTINNDCKCSLKQQT